MGNAGRLVGRTLIRGLLPSQARLIAGQATKLQPAPRRPFSSRVTSEGTTSGGAESLDQETERKAGWALKALAATAFVYVGMNVFPLMGDSLVTHSVALLRSKDPIFKRSGASRLSLIATNDQRRLKIVDAGGVRALATMFESASDDDTRREAVKALAILSELDAAVEALHKTGIETSVNTVSETSSDSETQRHTSFLLDRLKEWRTKGGSVVADSGHAADFGDRSSPGARLREAEHRKL